MTEEKVVVSAEAVAQSNENGGTDSTTYQNIIRSIIAEGGKRINGVRVKNANITDKENYMMVSLTLTTPIKGFIPQGDGTYKLGLTNTIFTSLYALSGAMKEDERISFLGAQIVESPRLVRMLLNGSTIDIVQQEIAQGVEYTNPFTTKEHPEPVTYDHDIIINNVIKVKLGTTGEELRREAIRLSLGY
jgi:hypothetical protein